MQTRKAVAPYLVAGGFGLLIVIVLLARYLPYVPLITAVFVIGWLIFGLLTVRYFRLPPK